VVNFGGTTLEASAHDVVLICQDCGERVVLSGAQRQRVGRRSLRVGACDVCRQGIVYDEVKGQVD